MSREKGLNVTITRKSSEILKKFVETGFFGSNENEIAKIAISYALGNGFEKDIDLNNYTMGDEERDIINKWAIGSINETYFGDVLGIIRPDIENINIALRNLIDIGLSKMDEILWNKTLNKIEIKKIFEQKI